MDKINLKAVLLQNMGEDSADFLPIMGDEKELLNDNMQIPDTLQFYRYGYGIISGRNHSDQHRTG